MCYFFQKNIHYKFNHYIVCSISASTGQPVTGTTIQQDPNDPTKWQVVQTPSNPALSPTEQGIAQPGRRLRRVACTCPNCKDNEGRSVTEVGCTWLHERQLRKYHKQISN